MGNIFTKRKNTHKGFTYADLTEHIEKSNELWLELYHVVKQHVPNLQVPQSAAFVPPATPVDDDNDDDDDDDNDDDDDDDDDARPKRPSPMVTSDSWIEMSTSSPDLVASAYSIRISLDTYVLLSSLLLNLRSVLTAGHLLTSLPKVSYTSEFTDSERIRDYLRRNEETKYDRECIICLSSTTETACNLCSVGVCNDCDARWKAEEGRSGCPVCREVGEGFEFAEYGGEDMLENVTEAARAIGKCFVNSVD